MDPWYLNNLVCPRDRQPLAYAGNRLTCVAGHGYPVVDGIPVMLLNDVEQTMDLVKNSIDRAQTTHGVNDLYIDSLGISEEEKRGVAELARNKTCKIDPVVAYLVGATNGIAYKHLIGRLDKYPIPELRLPDGRGKNLLDLGCNWGRWCIAAGRKGYCPIGIDPSLGAIMAARRVAAGEGVQAKFIVGDARFLPLKGELIDHVFSYSVLQHLNRENVERVLSEVERVLKPGGLSFIQMPTRYGVRCLYHQFRRRFREAARFEVRYWSVPSLQKLFNERIGLTEVSIDCFFGIGLQYADLHLMSGIGKCAILASEFLRHAAFVLPSLKYVADSIYLSSFKKS
jgi:SAM-dependent methyltransferase/uncharacterized protein YbaR (Trm112 family)